MESYRTTRNGVRLRKPLYGYWPDGKNLRRRGIDEYKAQNIPTLDDLHAVIGPMQEATIRQIVHGQAVYYGYDIEREFDNEVPMIGDPNVYETSLESNREERRAKNKKREMRDRLDKMIRRAEKIGNREEYERRKVRIRIVRTAAKFLSISQEEAFTQLKMKGCL